VRRAPAHATLATQICSPYGPYTVPRTSMGSAGGAVTFGTRGTVPHCRACSGVNDNNIFPGGAPKCKPLQCASGSQASPTSNVCFGECSLAGCVELDRLQRGAT
jgi:hypothetical protein